jgi:molybdate transport system permease protein
MGGVMSTLLILCLGAPIFALLTATDWASFSAALAHPLFMPAVWLSIRTSIVSVGIIVLTGTPLAWWLSRNDSALRRVCSGLVDLPIVIPPAVVGLALLVIFGRRGLIGGPLDTGGITIAFTDRAVILAQVIVAAPFYVRAVTAAFRMVDSDRLLVARTLGAHPWDVLFRVVLPSARAGISAGVSLAWARALGEFGATLIFAGSLPGETQTMPLAILSALEVDVRLAIVFALALAVIAVVALIFVRRLRKAGEWL